MSGEWKKGKLLKRYKRFLADVETDQGVITVHCPNTGSMQNCYEEGGIVWLSTSSNPKRKYAHTWEVSELSNGHRIGINTHKANQLVKSALISRQFEMFADYQSLKAEVKDETGHRIDFQLIRSDGQKEWIEVKSLTLSLEKGVGTFPDAVTKRGRAHIVALMEKLKSGDKATLVFCVQHTGIERVAIDSLIDPEFSKTLRQAMTQGLQVVAMQVDIAPPHMQVVGLLPIN